MRTKPQVSLLFLLNGIKQALLISFLNKTKFRECLEV